MLKAQTGEGFLRLMWVGQVAWKYGKTFRGRQTGVIIPIFKKGDRKQSTNYTGITLLGLPGKVYAKWLEMKCQERVECQFLSGSQHHRPDLYSEAIVREIFGVWQRSLCMLCRSWKGYDRAPWDKLWKVLREYGIGGHLLCAIKPFHCRPEVSVWVNSKQSESFYIGVGLQQGWAPFHCLHELGRQKQPSWWACNIWKLQNQWPAVRWWFGSTFFHRIWPPALVK